MTILLDSYMWKDHRETDKTLCISDSGQQDTIWQEEKDKIALQRGDQRYRRIWCVSQKDEDLRQLLHQYDEEWCMPLKEWVFDVEKKW